MSNTGVLAKYVDLRPVFNKTRAQEMQKVLGYKERHELDQLFCTSRKGGKAFLMPGAEPVVIMEMVVGPNMEDSSTVLYEPHPVFNTRGEYLEAREELVTLIEDLADAGPQGVAVHCPIRGRAVMLSELNLLAMVEIVRTKVIAFTSH